MKSFERTLGTLAGIFLLIIIISIALISSYAGSHDISFSNLFNSPDYETLEITNSDNFPIVEEIFISTSVEQVIFIEEDRDDILVEYRREAPDTDFYKVRYRVREDNGRLSVTASHSSQLLSFNNNYYGAITIYIPTDTHFEKITIDSSMANLESRHLYSNADAIAIITDLGNIDFEASYPAKKIEISCNLGDIDFKNTAAIETLDLSCDSGSIDVTIEADINTVQIDENMGSVDVKAYAPIHSITIENDLGNIDGIYKESVNKAYMKTNLGSVDVTFYNNDDMLVFADSDMGKVDSDYSITSKRDSDFEFISNLGSVTIRDK